MTHSSHGRTATFHLPRARRSLAIATALAVLVTGTVFGQAAESASAKDYPSWSDVQAARTSVAAKEAEIKRLDGLLAGLATGVTSTQAIAQQKGEEAFAARQKSDEASFKSDELKKQADAAKAKAATSKQQAGQLAAKLARSGGGNDLSTTLFFSGDKADSLLSQLGLASMVKDQSSGLYDRAVQDQNTAQSLTDQADVAKNALKTLSDVADKALVEANAASDRAAAALSEQQDNKGRMEAQRASLVQNTSNVESEYNAGVAAAIAEAKAKAAAAAAAAAAYAAAHPAESGGSAGAPSTSGWYRPAGGRISSGFGWRNNPVTHVNALHAGTDLAAGCNSPIFAAHSGTVSFAGWSGGYGNFILIDNGGGVFTGYGHIVNGGTLVSKGQQVSGGQQIARVGSTGHSTGCHLHFETRPGGKAVDAVPFMADRGVRL
ncbi:peptidoglycan DD-metalloendopeptidase family protein [Glaciihabitans sp. UYNi722]|uniref:peptidoglycan DD-metalloendopeptidase family protein n=1 Tax=Glaciihabitans sp. UYNi722 TaxID=3156344 RepID=UPI003395D73C